MSLTLPPPSNGATPTEPPNATDAFLSMILPPPEIRSIVDKTAVFVAKNPKPELFEEKIRLREKSDSRFAFLNKTDAYHAYYQHRLEAFRAGEVLEAKVVAVVAQGAAKDENEGRPIEPPNLEFLVEIPPSINAVDLDILRLTALFTARSGRQFISELSTREARNYQFDFLRPSHSLFGYFNRLVDQYTKILIPSKEGQARLERRSGGSNLEGEARKAEGRRQVLTDAKVRSEWEKWESGRQKEKDDAEEAERIAFAEIDWQDFVVVSTVEFTEGDEAGLVELPPPMSISEVENMTIAQKKMAAMIMEGREEELEEIERERLAAEESEITPVTQTIVPEEVRVEKERRKAVEIKMADSTGPMKIRKDYIAKADRPTKAAQAYTQFGGQQVPVEDFAEHMRIELLDPKWKEQKRATEANRSASNLLPGGTDVSAALREMAANRADIFGTGVEDEGRKTAEAALKAQQKERERNVWDGHTASAEGITDRAQAGANFDEQIAAIHRAKGLISTEDGQQPKIGPSITANNPIIEPSFISGSTFSAAPNQNATSYSLPSYSQQSGYGQPTGQNTSDYPNQPGLPTPMPGLPARPAVQGIGEDYKVVEQQQQGRQMDDGPDGEPGAKKVKITSKKTDGGYYPEEDWIASHPDPISVTIHLPTVSDKPAWGCDGSTLILENVPQTLLVGTLRDRISAKVGLPIGKQRLTFGGKMLSMTITLASLNVENGDLISVTIKDGKKK